MSHNKSFHYSAKMENQKHILPIGKILLGTVAGLTAVGGFLADWNKTHLFNPAWPPHAKFHDALTISAGTLLGSAGLYYLLRNGGNQSEDLKVGTLLPAIFWASQGLSFAFPGAKGLESEFPGLIPRVKGVWINELFAAAGMLALTSAGYALEQNRLSKEK